MLQKITNPVARELVARASLARSRCLSSPKVESEALKVYSDPSPYSRDAQYRSRFKLHFYASEEDFKQAADAVDAGPNITKLMALMPVRTMAGAQLGNKHAFGKRKQKDSLVIRLSRLWDLTDQDERAKFLTKYCLQRKKA